MAKLSELWQKKHDESVANYHTLYSARHQWFRRTENGFEFGYTEMHWHFLKEPYPYQLPPEMNPFLEVDDIDIDETELLDVAQYRELISELLQF